MPTQSTERPVLSPLSQHAETAEPWYWRWFNAMLEMDIDRIIEVAPLRGNGAQMFVAELGSILEEFPCVQRAAVCNVQTRGDDWQLLLLLDLAPGYRQRWHFWLLHRRLQRLLAINLLCRHHCPAPLLNRLEPMLIDVL